jgi:uncharacterized protein (TIGR03437 family)
VTVALECGGDRLGQVFLDRSEAAPALFTAAMSGVGQASILNQDYSYNGTALFAVPAPRGSSVMVYGTGFGRVRPPDPDGLSRLELPVQATVGGLAAVVEYAGLAPGWTVGLQQINVKIPLECPTGPSVPIQIQAGAQTTQMGTTLAVY